MTADLLDLLKTITPDSDLEAFNGILGQVSASMFPPGMRLLYARIADLREQDLNANSMPKKMFDQLWANIKAAGAPESLPLVAKIKGEGDTVWIVSGHHRTRAAAAAGHTHILCICYDQLEWSRARAKQLAHNSIAGSSDPEIIKRIWEQIDDAAARFEAFIDTRLFDDIPETVRFQPVDTNFNDLSKTILVIFLNTQHQDMEKALQEVIPKGQIDGIYLAHQDAYDTAMQVLKRARAELDIKAVPTALAEVFRLALERLDELAEEHEAEDLPEV